MSRRGTPTTRLTGPTPAIGLVDEHKAELLGAAGKFEEAVCALPKSPCARAPARVQQALGELYLIDGPARAGRNP